MVEKNNNIIYNDGVYPYPFPCIYKLIFGDDFYIGQTINLDSRVKSHAMALKKNHGAIKLQEAYDRCGGVIHVEIVEPIPPDADKIFLNQRELHYIQSLKPTLNGDSGSCGQTDRRWVKPPDARLLPIRGDLLMGNAEAVKKHHEKLDEFKIRPYKEEGQQIRDAAATLHMSVQALFLEAVREYIANHKEET